MAALSSPPFMHASRAYLDSRIFSWSPWPLSYPSSAMSETLPSLGPSLSLLRALQLIVIAFSTSNPAPGFQLDLSLFSGTLLHLIAKTLWAPCLLERYLCLPSSPFATCSPKGKDIFLVFVSLSAFLQYLAHSGHSLRVL